MSFPGMGALWGLLALTAIPFVIHWLSSRFPKKFIFSSLDDIRKSLAGRSRLFRWRHFLYLMLRGLALLALVFVFFKPVVGVDPDAVDSGQRQVLLLIDQSMSMSHADDNMSTYRRARIEASKLLDSLDPLDKANVMLVGRSPRMAFSQFSHNIGAAKAFIEEAEPQATEADFHAANLMASQLIEAASGPVDIFYLSDFQRKNWADVQFDGMPEIARLFFIPVTDDDERRNQAILDASISDRLPSARRPFSVKVRVGNFSRDQYNGKLEALISESLAVDKMVSLAPWAETELELELPGLTPGFHGIELRLPADQLPLDNTRHLVVEVQETEEVVIFSEAVEVGGEAASSTRFLHAAINPFGEGKGSYRVEEVHGDALDSAALSGCAKLVASKTPKLSELQASALADFLGSGGGVLMFLDGEHDEENLAKLSSQIGSPLPMTLGGRITAENLPNGAMQVAQGDFRSRFLRLFQGERRKNLGFLEFYDLYYASSTGEGRVLLHYADGTPALTETQAGLGTLLLGNFSVSELSSNLARQRLFPGWIHDLLVNLGTTNAEGLTYLVGDTIYTEAWASEAMGRAVIGPGNIEYPAQSQVRGERILVNFEATEPGVYRLPGKGGRTLEAFAVNPPNRESDLRTMDADILPARAGGQGVASLLKSRGSYEELRQGHPTFHWFVLAALVFLALETLLHGYLNRSLKPKPTT